MLQEINIIYVFTNMCESAHIVTQEYITLCFWDVFNKCKAKYETIFILTSVSLVNDTIMQ